MRQNVMVFARATSLAAALVLVFIGGCGAAEVAGRPTQEDPAVSTTLECDNTLRNIGEPDYVLPAEPITDPPVEQAERYVEGTRTRRDYPDVAVVLAEQEPTAQIIALVSANKSVGILRYENDDALGWHLTSTAQCSPMR